MGKSANIRNYVGAPVEILGETYNMKLTMLGSDYLEEIYGNPLAAFNKYNEMIKRLKEVGVDKDCRETLINFVYAAIIHNQFDEQGNVVRKLPTAFELKSSLMQNDLIGLLQVMTKAQTESLPDVTDIQEEKAGDPIETQ
jgi:hypothetical protein